MEDPKEGVSRMSSQEAVEGVSSSQAMDEEGVALRREANNENSASQVVVEVGVLHNTPGYQFGRIPFLSKSYSH